jgi:hypothetical protein
MDIESGIRDGRRRAPALTHFAPFCSTQTRSSGLTKDHPLPNLRAASELMQTEHHVVALHTG